MQDLGIFLALHISCTACVVQVACSVWSTSHHMHGAHHAQCEHLCIALIHVFGWKQHFILQVYWRINTCYPVGMPIARVSLADASWPP